VVSWRWIFFLLVPIGIAGVVLTALRARSARRTQPATPVAIDYAGAALLVVLTVVLTVLVDRRSAEMIGVGKTGFMTTIFAAALVGFVVRERRARQPVVNLALFRIRMFTFSVVSLLIVGTTGSTLMLLLPFYLQDVLHESPAFMGLLFLAAPIFTIGLAPITGWATDRVGPRLPTSIGVVVTMAAFAVGTCLRVDSHWTMPALLMALVGIGTGFFNTANQTGLIGSVPREYRGFATGMTQMVFGLGALLGTSLGSLLLTVMFRYATGRPDATPTADQPAAFVFAMNAACAVCLAFTTVAFVTSVMRGGARVGAPTA
jgi:MFS family permease